MSDLLDIKFFQDVSDVLEVTKDEDFAKLKPGEVAPPEAVVIGPMSISIKKFLVFSSDVFATSQGKLFNLIKVGSTLSPEEIEVRLEEISAICDFATQLNKLFKLILEYEYNEGDIDTTRLSYDENFFVYYIPQV